MPEHLIHERAEARDRQRQLEREHPALRGDLAGVPEDVLAEYVALLERQRFLLGEHFHARGGRFVRVPGRLRIIGPRLRAGTAPARAQEAVSAAWGRVLRRRQPQVAWKVNDGPVADRDVRSEQSHERAL